MNSFNLKDLLSWSRAKLVKQSGTPLLDEFSNIVEWVNLPRGAKEELRQYVLDNLQIVNNVSFPNTQEKLSGTYCATKVDTYDTDNGVTLHVTYDKYYFDTWQWSEAELTEPAHLDDTTNFAIFKMKHCNDNKLVAILASVPTSFDNQVTHAGTLTGTWKKIKARTYQVEDGRGWVLLFCARAGINVALYGDASVYDDKDAFKHGYTDYYYGVVDPNVDGLVLGSSPYVYAAGFTFQKGVSRNSETGLYDVTIQKKVSDAVTNAEIGNYSGFAKTTLYESISVAKDRNQASQKSNPPFSAGTIIKQTSAENEFGKFDSETATITANAVASADSTKTISASSIVERTQNKNQTSEETQPSVAIDGVVKSVRNEKNDFGRYDTDIHVDTAVKVDSAQVSFLTENGSAWTRTIENATAGEVTALAATLTNGTVSVSPSQYPGRFTVHATNHPASGSGSGSSVEYGFFQSSSMPLSDEDAFTMGGKTYVGIIVQQLVTASKSDANNFFYGNTVNGHAAPGILTNEVLVPRAAGYHTSVSSGSKHFAVTRVYAGT